MWEVLILFLFYKRRNPGLEKWINIILYLSDLRLETFYLQRYSWMEQNLIKIPKSEITWFHFMKNLIQTIFKNQFLLFNMARNNLSMLKRTTCSRPILYNNLSKTQTQKHQLVGLKLKSIQNFSSYWLKKKHIIFWCVCVYVKCWNTINYSTMNILEAGILHLGSLKLQGHHLCLHLCTFGHLYSQMCAQDMISCGNYTFKGTGEGDIK